MESLLGDIRFAFRSLLKSPGFALATVLTLALGIGANTAIFSLIHGVLLAPLPYRDGGRLVVLQQSAPKAEVDNLAFSIKEVHDYRAANQTLSGLVEHHAMTFTLLGRDEPERVSTGVVSAEYFDVLGIKPLVGRTFRSRGRRPRRGSGPRSEQRLLAARLRRRPGVIGQTLEMNDKTHTVVGVLPPIPQFPQEHDVYMPTSACPFRAPPSSRSTRTAAPSARSPCSAGFGTASTSAAVQSDFSAIGERFERDYPETYPDESGYAIAATSLQDALTVGARPTLLILLGTSALVLLIACANVTNLAVARLIRREREMALRASLGAGRRRILQQTVVESALLSLAGAGSGIDPRLSGARRPHRVHRPFHDALGRGRDRRLGSLVHPRRRPRHGARRGSPSRLHQQAEPGRVASRRRPHHGRSRPAPGPFRAHRGSGRDRGGPPRRRRD